MSDNNILVEKIDNVFNLLDKEQVLEADIIQYISNLIQSSKNLTLPDASKEKLLSIIKKQLQTTNTETQKESLTLLCQCFDIVLFDKEKLVSELLLIIIEGVFKNKLDNLEDQELWLKALDALLKFSDPSLTPLILKHSLEILEAIKLALASKVSNSPKKLKALKLLGDFISKIELNEANTKILLSILFTILIPSLFNDETKCHFKIILDMSYKIINKIPFTVRKADQNYTTFMRNQFVCQYVPFLSKMVHEEILMYCQLWKFCLKILESDILSNSSLINNLLSVLEKAFKAKNMNLRKEAFIFWQDFIERFLTLSKEKIATHKIKLLIIPLRSNITKTSELYCLKYQTWCILLNTLHKLKIYPQEFQMIFDDFLNFSFGPTNPVKKMPNLQIKLCENFLKILATEELIKNYSAITKYDIVCEGSMITKEIFMKSCSKIVNAIEEASVLLNSNLENPTEAKILMKFLWEALFNFCEREEIVGEIFGSVTRIIEVEANQKLFVIETILQILTKNSEVCNKMQFKNQMLVDFIPTKLFENQNSTIFYSLSDTPEILQLILYYKKDKPEFLNQISNQFLNIAKEKTDDQKIMDNLFKIWGVLLNEVSRKNLPFDSTLTFTNLTIWALDHLKFSSPSKKPKIIETLRKNLEKFSYENSSINSTCGILIQKISLLVENLDETNSEILYNIFTQLSFKKGDTEVKKDLTNILKNLLEIVKSEPFYTKKVVDNIKKCIDHIFTNCLSKVLLSKILPILKEIIQNLLKKYPDVDLTETVNAFTKKYQHNEKTKPILQEIVTVVFENRSEQKNQAFYKKYFQELDSEPSIFSLNTEKLVIDGVDLDTMSPIKLKGSILNNLDHANSNSKNKKETPTRKKEAPKKPLNKDFIFDMKVETPKKSGKKNGASKDVSGTPSKEISSITGVASKESVLLNGDSDTPKGVTVIKKASKSSKNTPLKGASNVTGAKLKGVSLTEGLGSTGELPGGTKASTKAISTLTSSLSGDSPLLDSSEFKNQSSLEQKETSPLGVDSDPKRTHSEAAKASALMGATSLTEDSLKESTKSSSKEATSTKATLKEISPFTGASPLPESSPQQKKETPSRKKDPNDEFIVVNTPYSFNPKKLTKTQREKLSRRRDDIPAMYNDLSQSQTMDFSNSQSSQLELTQPTVIELTQKDPTENPAESKISISPSLATPEFQQNSNKRAFSEISINNTENKSDENLSSKKPKKVENELKKLVMSNIVGFEDVLKKSAVSEKRQTRNRNTKKDSDTKTTPEISPNNPSKRRRSKKITESLSQSDVIESSQNSNDDLLSSQSSPDILDTAKENLSFEKMKQQKQSLLEDLGVKIKRPPNDSHESKTKFNVSDIDRDNRETTDKTIKINFNISDLDSDKITSEISKDHTKLQLTLVKPRIIKRRNSLESAPNLSLTNEFNEIDEINNFSKKRRRNSLRDEFLSTSEEIENENERKIPKLKISRSPTEKQGFVIESMLEKIDEKMETETETETGNLETQTEIENEKDTESVPIEMFENTPVKTVEYPNANTSICRKVIFEKNSEDTDPTNIENSEKSTPKESVIEICTSPLRHDTPNRNKEFLDNTLEISPIKNTSQRTLTFEKPDETNEVKKDEKSPELFNSDNPTKEVVFSECLTPTLPKRKLKNKFSQGRIAQMMNLINPNGCQKSDITSKDAEINPQTSKSEVRISTPIISNSRISKMMVQFDNRTNLDRLDEITETPTKSEPVNEQDFLRFTKDIPLPTASPRFGILRKRKHPDEPEEGISPLTKKKRVNFNDPTLTELKFVEKYQNIRNRSSSILFTSFEDRLAEQLQPEPEIPSDLMKNEDLSSLCYNKKKITVIDSANTSTVNNLELHFSSASQSSQNVDTNKTETTQVTAQKQKEILFEKQSEIDENQIVEDESPITSEKEKIEIISNSTSSSDETKISTENSDETQKLVDDKKPSQKFSSSFIEGTESCQMSDKSTDCHKKSDNCQETADNCQKTADCQNPVKSHQKSIDSWLKSINGNQISHQSEQKFNEGSLMSVITHSTENESYRTSENVGPASNDTESIPETSSENKIDTSTYEKHLKCTESLSICLPQTPDNVKLISFLRDENIKTMGDFTKFVMEDPSILVTFHQIKNILDNHNCNEHQKPLTPRKIKPTTLSSPRKIKNINNTPTKSYANEINGPIETEELLGSVSQSTPSRFDRNITESQEKLVSDSETDKNEGINVLKRTSDLSLGITSGGLDWNKIFSEIIGSKADEIIKFLLLQEDSRDINFIRIVKFILNHDSQKFIKTILEVLKNSRTIREEFFDDFVPFLLKNSNLTSLKNNLTLPQLQDLFMDRLKSDYDNRKIISFNSEELFETILKFSPKNIQSFIPKILSNPHYNNCIIQNLSLIELQQHVIDRLSKDSDNKEEFLRRLNKSLGKKLVIQTNVTEMEITNSDSIESSSENGLRSTVEILKNHLIVLEKSENVSEGDWTLLKEISQLGIICNNIFYKHIAIKAKK